jgi:hypothetical protein
MKSPTEAEKNTWKRQKEKEDLEKFKEVGRTKATKTRSET